MSLTQAPLSLRAASQYASLKVGRRACSVRKGRNGSFETFRHVSVDSPAEARSVNNIPQPNMPGQLNKRNFPISPARVDNQWFDALNESDSPPV